MLNRTSLTLAVALFALPWAGCLDEDVGRSGSEGEGGGQGEGAPEDGGEAGSASGDDGAPGGDVKGGGGEGDIKGGGKDEDPDAPSSECGNGEKEAGEACDGDDLGTLTCEALGHYGGELRCEQCKADDRACVPPPPDDLPECGDGVKAPGEACDRDDLGGLTCTDLGYDEGRLRCTDDCEFMAKGCNEKAADCGNHQLDPGETCDGSTADLTCESLGFTGGVLSCDPIFCFLDTGKCE